MLRTHSGTNIAIRIIVKKIEMYNLYSRKAVISYEKWIVPEKGGERGMRDGEHDDKKMCYYNAFTEMGLHITINQGN